MSAMTRYSTDLKQTFFLLIDLLGIALCIAGLSAPEHWKLFLLAVGPLLTSVGISAQIATLKEVSRRRAEALVEHCEQAGIVDIFPSRRQNSTELAEKQLAELDKSQGMDLLGVAHRRMFDPSDETTEVFSMLLHEPTKPVRVMVLDPECDAAREREAIECGNATTGDIVQTLSNGLIALLAARIHHLQERTACLDLDDCESRRAILKSINLQVKTYDSHPVAHVMRFDSSLFCEQYHTGRPGMVPVGGCIGKYMPVIQYRKDSMGYLFMSSHFENLWQQSADITPVLIGHALKMLSKADARR